MELAKKNIIRFYSRIKISKRQVTLLCLSSISSAISQSLILAWRRMTSGRLLPLPCLTELTKNGATASPLVKKLKLGGYFPSLDGFSTPHPLSQLVPAHLVVTYSTPNSLAPACQASLSIQPLTADPPLSRGSRPTGNPPPAITLTTPGDKENKRNIHGKKHPSPLLTPLVWVALVSH